MSVLVTGARGNVGAAVVRGLLEEGVEVRAVSRSADPSGVPAGVQTVRGDLTRPETLSPALDGVTAVFLYAEADGGEELVALLRDHHVARVVLLSSASVVFPDADSNPIAQRHLALEQLLRDGRFAWTFVRPAYFATNALRWTSIRTDRVLRTAFPDGQTPMVHERDIADLAVAALLDDGLAGTALNALGAGRSTVRQQVATIADAVGTPVDLEVLTVEQYRRELAGQLPGAIIDRLVAARGFAPLPDPAVARDSVRQVLGRDPLTFEQWVSDHVADFRRP